MRIRLAELADAEAIRAIYNVEVLESTNTFDMVPRSQAEQEAWILEHSGVHPALVATEPPGSRGDGDRIGANGEIVLGFGSLSAFRERSGYSATAENSVYVDRAQRGKGVGKALLAELAGPGLGPRLPLGDRPDRRAQRDLHRPARGGRVSSWSGSSARSGASTASGSTWSSSSGCSDERARGRGQAVAERLGLEDSSAALVAGRAGQARAVEPPRRRPVAERDDRDGPEHHDRQDHAGRIRVDQLAQQVGAAGEPDERRHGREAEDGVEPAAGDDRAPR